MVGSALGNSIILRSDKEFGTLWSLECFFCQKDVPKNNVDEVKNEFDLKINESVSKRVNNEKRRKKKILNLKDYPLFGIFSKV